MQRNLFTKYFSICSAVVLLGITVLGVFFMSFAAGYFREDKYQLLSRNLEMARNFTAQEYADTQYSGMLNTRNCRTIFRVLASALDADIYLTDIKGNTLICSHDFACNHTAGVISEQIVSQVLETGSFTETGNLGGIYRSHYYTVAAPVQAGDQVIGLLFVSSSADTLNDFLTEMLQLFLISALLVLVICFIVIYFVTSRLVRPLREMVAATQSFINGDFTVRIPVDGYTEIDRLGMAFNNMASSLGELETTRRSFVANVSHELKTPMQTIAGFIDGILDGTIPEEKQRHYLSIVSDEVKRLARLVRSMLDLARIEAGETTLQSKNFDVNEIVMTTVFTFEQAIEAKHLDVRGLDAGKFMVYADEDLIHQVVYNLVDNAVKFVNDGGYLEFTYRVEGAVTYIGVKNSGDGISKQEISHVFDRFYKTDRSRGLDKNGVGLGLHIVRSIVNMHSGEIIVRSVEKEYCEFVFSLPTGSARAAKRKPAEQ